LPTRTSPTPTHTPIPAVSDAAAAAGLVDVRTAVPDAILDLRYATTNNFTKVRLYPRDARCLVHEDLVTGLRHAASVLRKKGYRLVFWDCYRPREVQEHMFEVVPDPAWVARPGPYARSHTAARSVDVTIAHRDGEYLDMGTDFDSFTPQATAYATDGVTARQRANRKILREAMQSDPTLTIYDGEWWHFDGPGAAVDRPHLDVPVD